MVSFLQGLTSGLRGAYCSQVSNSPQWFSNLREVLVPGDLARRADALNRWVCDKPPEELPPVPPDQLPGGQCPVAYIFQWQERRFVGGQWVWSATFTISATGPLSIRKADDRPPFICSTPPATFDGNAALFDGAGVRRQQLANLCSDDPQGWRLISLTRSDGQPDNCGSQPPDLPPPGPQTVNVDINYEGDDNTEYNLTVPVIFAPVYVALDGSLRIPISIGDLNFNGEINFNPDFNLEITPPTDTGGGTADDPDLEESGDPDLDGPPPPDGPEGTIVGVIVRSTRFGPVRSTTIFQSGMPDILAPRIANVRFLCRFGSVTAWTSDQPVKGVNEYIPCPSPFGAIDVVVVAETNWSTSSTAVRSRPPAIFLP